MREWQKIAIGIAAVILIPTVPAVLCEARWYIATHGDVGHKSESQTPLGGDGGGSRQTQPLAGISKISMPGSEGSTFWEKALNLFPSANGWQAIFAFMLTIATFSQLKIIRRQGQIMERQRQLSSDALEITRDTANSTKQAAEATARALVRDRAYIFVDYVSHTPFTTQTIPQMPEGTAHYETTVYYKVTNHGSTPAIVTNIESRGFMKNRYLDGDLELPDPRSNKDATDFGSRGPQRPRINETGSYFDDHIAPRQVVLRGNGESYTVEHQMWFQNRPSHPDRKIHHLWVHCVVRYEDIYSNPRITSYYAKAGGTAGAYKVNDSVNNYRT